MLLLNIYRIQLLTTQIITDENMSSGDLTEISSNLFVGSAKASRNIELLTSCGITHILNIAGRQYFPGKFVYKRSHFEDVEDFDEIEQVRDMFQWIDKMTSYTTSKVLVQCMGGMSRSASVTIGYLVWTKKFTLNEALAFVKTLRPQIRPRQLNLMKRIEMEVYSSSGK